DITLVSRNLRRSGMNRLHRRTTKTVYSLTCNSFWQVSKQCDVTRNVHALFQGLVYTAPDHVFNFVYIKLVTSNQCTNEFSRQAVSTYIAEHTVFGFTHC